MLDSVIEQAKNLSFAFHPDVFAASFASSGAHDTGLNLAERAWKAWYAAFESDVIATGVMSFVMHEFFYFARCLPWMIIDQMPYFRKWKLQPDRIPSNADQWRCIKLVLFVHFTVEMPQIVLFHPLATSVGMKTSEVPFPSLLTIITQILIFSVVEDMWHYWVHRLAHHRLIYKHVHKWHHMYSAPFGLAAEYAHPAETLILGAGTVIAPLGFCWLWGDMHLVTMYLWIIFRLVQAVDSHSGYDFPWSLNKILPVWAGAEHHDYHHEKFTDCYSSSWTWFDWACGTDQKYKQHRLAQKAARERMAKADKAE